MWLDPANLVAYQLMNAVTLQQQQLTQSNTIICLLWATGIHNTFCIDPCMKSRAMH